MQIQPARSREFDLSRSGNVGVGADDVHLLNTCYLIADGETQRSFVLQLDVLHIGRELIHVGLYSDLAWTLKRAAQHEVPGDRRVSRDLAR